MSRIRPSRFVHVVYRTRRFDEMIAWYQAVFDCKVQYQNPALAFLTYDDEHHRVALINMAAVGPPLLLWLAWLIVRERPDSGRWSVAGGASNAGALPESSAPAEEWRVRPDDRAPAERGRVTTPKP